MPFKIVETLEKGNKKLFIVPSGWEWKGQLRFPKKSADNKLCRDENSKPRPEWPVISCKVKRTSLLSYKTAEHELNNMLQYSDTDLGEYEEIPKCTDEVNAVNSSSIDYNNLAEHLIFQPQNTGNNTAEEGGAEQEAVYYIHTEADNLTPSVEPEKILQKLDTIIENQTEIMGLKNKVDQIIENQNNIIVVQNKLALRLANVVVDIENVVENSLLRFGQHYYQREIPLAQTSIVERTSFMMEPVDSINDLNKLEMLLSNSDEKNKLMQQYAILCTGSKGNGVTFAYKLLDIMFTREFLCNCSWSGGSRGDTIKVPLKSYKNILNFFFRMIFSWDSSFTIEDNEVFFKNVLKNAGQRQKTKNIRTSAKKCRSRKVIKKQKKTDTNIGQAHDNFEHIREDRETDRNISGTEITHEQADQNMERDEKYEEEVEETQTYNSLKYIPEKSGTQVMGKENKDTGKIQDQKEIVKNNANESKKKIEVLENIKIEFAVKRNKSDYHHFTQPKKFKHAYERPNEDNQRNRRASE